MFYIQMPSLSLSVCHICLTADLRLVEKMVKNGEKITEEFSVDCYNSVLYFILVFN